MNHPGLGAHLNGHHAGQFQVVELLFKAVAQVGVVVVLLGRLLGLGLGGGLLELGQGLGAGLVQGLLARQDIHGQLLIIFRVQIIHLVQHGDVLHQGQLVVFQHCHNLIHIGIGLVKAGLQGHGLLFLLLEEAENAAFLLLAEGLQLHHQGGQSLTYLAQVLGAHVVQGVFREVGNVLLGGSAVLEHHGGVGEVNFLGKILHHLLLLGGELNLCHGLLGGRRGSGGCRGSRGVQGGI